MTTTLHRYSVTETPAVARALDLAAVTWPELRDNRAALLRRIVEWGAVALEEQRARVLDERREALRRYAGAMEGVFPVDAARRAEDEWPE